MISLEPQVSEPLARRDVTGSNRIYDFYKGVMISYPDCVFQELETKVRKGKPPIVACQFRFTGYFIYFIYVFIYLFIYLFNCNSK